VLNYKQGVVHFHLVPYCDPRVVAHEFEDESVKKHNQAMDQLTLILTPQSDKQARHVLFGHAFVAPYVAAEEHQGDQQTLILIGGSEDVDAKHFKAYDYTALGQLHQAHYVKSENVRYAGSILKYSLSEANHNKGYFIVEMDSNGVSHIEKRSLTPKRDLRALEGKIDDLLQLERSNDYVFVRLLDETPVLSPMEKLRTVFPNCMHVERKLNKMLKSKSDETKVQRQHLSEIELFRAFYKEVTDTEASLETETI